MSCNFLVHSCISENILIDKSSLQLMRQKWFLYAIDTFTVTLYSMKWMPNFKEQVKMAVVLFLNHLIIQSYYHFGFQISGQQTKIRSFQSLAESLILDFRYLLQYGYNGTKYLPNILVRTQNCLPKNFYLPCIKCLYHAFFDTQV